MQHNEPNPGQNPNNPAHSWAAWAKTPRMLWLPECSPLLGWKDTAHQKTPGWGFTSIPLITQLRFCLLKQSWTGGWVLRAHELPITQTAFKTHPAKCPWNNLCIFGEVTISAITHVNGKRQHFACFWGVPCNQHAPRGAIKAIYAAMRFSVGSCYSSVLTFIFLQFSGCLCILQIRKLILKEQTSFYYLLLVYFQL